MEECKKQRTSGPCGFGDPDDLTLRKVEREVLIPKKMREKARTEKCLKEAQEFSDCCKQHGLLIVVRCRQENTKLKNCLTQWYNNEEFKTLCTQEYLQERSDFRRTGIFTNPRLHRVGT